MADAKTEQEPSIEEILESIRQIISEDGDAPVKPSDLNLSAKPAEAEKPDVPLSLTPAAEIDFESELVLVDDPEQPDTSNLTLKGDAEDTHASDLDLSAQEEEGDDVLDLTEVVEPEHSQGTSHMEQPTDPNILSDVTADAATAAMARLLAGNIAVERDEPSRVGNVTLEDLAREMMRPMIKTWLDKNLPKVIEKMVSREIEKLSRRAMDK